MSPITTHVLDTSTGHAAPNMEVRLDRRASAREWTQIAVGRTDHDGRIKDFSSLAGSKRFEPGVYRLVFDTAGYFEPRQIESLYPYVEIVFTVSWTNPARYYHLPLLISPFGYTTYRGS